MNGNRPHVFVIDEAGNPVCKWCNMPLSLAKNAALLGTTIECLDTNLPIAEEIHDAPAVSPKELPKSPKPLTPFGFTDHYDSGAD